MKDADPALARAVDAWIERVLRAGGVRTFRLSDGSLGIEAPGKYVRVIDALSAGIHAATRGEELPEVVATEPKKRR